MADEVPRDRRSALVRRDAKACPVSLVCYLCCAEFGTSSLKIHEKSCRKKHAWGLQNVLDDETVSSAQAKKNRAKCAEPSPTGPAQAVPASGADSEEVAAYNDEALRMFKEHAAVCLWCRMNNADAARKREAEEAERLRREAEEEERRRRLLANGKRAFLRKGEGVQAATQSAAVLETRKAEVKAREDIAAFSLSHAKKSGLVRPTAPKRAGDGVSMEEMDEATEARWDAEWSTHEEAAFSATRTSHGPTGAGGAA